MNFLQRVTLGGIGGLNLNVKKVGSQVSLVESYRDGQPVLQPYSAVESLNNGLRKNPFLYSAMRKKADAIASVPFYVEEFSGGEWRRVINHPAEHLIEGANPFMSGFELKKLMVYHKELVGSAYMQIVLVGGKPAFLQPLFPQHTKVVPSAQNFIAGFEYEVSAGEKKKFRADEVFWTKHTDPADPYKGLSPLASIEGEVQTDAEARRWNKVSLANRGASDVAFILRDAITEDDYELAKQMIHDRYAGASNARMPWILTGNADVRPMVQTAIEMDYINTRKFNREVIAAALGVPAVLIGDADNSTFDNIVNLKKDFWQDTISNYLEEIRQDLTRQILVPYYGDGRRIAPRLRYMYDLSNVEALQSNVKEKAETAKLLREVGYSLENINQYLEFGMELSEEEKNPTPPPAAPDEARVRSMVDVIFASGAKGALFERAIASVHESLASAAGKAPNLGMARRRAIEYEACEVTADEIVAREIGVVRGV